MVPVDAEAKRQDACWQELLQEATEALIQMDADRLEELARCCADLNRQPKRSRSAKATSPQSTPHRSTASQFTPSSFPAGVSAERQSLATLARLLEETRANLRVLTHLHLLRLKAEAGTLEQWESWQHRSAGACYGDN